MRNAREKSQRLPSPSADAGGLFSSAHVRFTAHSGLKSDIGPCPQSAMNGLMHRSKLIAYSIALSVRAGTEAGTVRSSALAVSRLTTSPPKIALD
jgi:hypothetical protein